MDSKKEDRIKVQLSLSPETIKTLRNLASSPDEPLSEVLMRVIETQGFLQEQVRLDNRVLLESSNGNLRQLRLKK